MENKLEKIISELGKTVEMLDKLYNEKDIPLDIYLKIHEIYGGICCHPECKNTESLEVHHIIFRSDGGKHRLENLILLCHEHHFLAHSKDKWRRHWENRRGKIEIVSDREMLDSYDRLLF